MKLFQATHVLHAQQQKGKCAVCKMKVCDLCAIGGDEMEASKRRCRKCALLKCTDINLSNPKMKEFKKNNVVSPGKPKDGRIQWGSIDSTYETLINSLLPKEFNIIMEYFNLKRTSELYQENQIVIIFHAELCNSNNALTFLRKLLKYLPKRIHSAY